MALETHIKFNDDRRLGITLTAHDGLPPLGPSKTAALRFLSIVETSQVPLHMILGSPLHVSTHRPETESWLSSIILQQLSRDDNNSPWWGTSLPNSPLGILLSIEDGSVRAQQMQPRPTELLIYAELDTVRAARPTTPPPSSPLREEASAIQQDSRGQLVSVRALVLSSDLLHRPQYNEPSPPASPASPTSQHDHPEAIFLPATFPDINEIIHEPPVKRRKTATDAFDEASERRQKARRKGGAAVAAAAASKTSEPQLPSLKHQRSVSVASTSVPLQTRRLSRSPSVASTRAPVAAAPKSSLSRVQSASAPDKKESTIETKNKELISRTVMAGMRLYGLSQSKSRRAAGENSTAPASPAADLSFEEMEADRRRDEEFKLIYHQVFKGACFAVRRSIAGNALLPHTEAVRDTVDRLLAIFCHDPLANGIESGRETDQTTPGGRKAFGTDGVHPTVSASPFAVAVKASGGDVPSALPR